MSKPSGFNEVKKAVIVALESGDFQHEPRHGIEVKNKLQTGEVVPSEAVRIIKRCNGANYSTSPHRLDRSIDVHIIKSSTWYVKFYFLDPMTVFISLHQ